MPREPVKVKTSRVRFDAMQDVSATTPDDGAGYCPEPGNPDLYRCPVSTPALDAKRPMDNFEPTTGTVSPSIQGRKSVNPTRFKSSLQRSRTRDIDTPTRKNVEYYFVDKSSQKKEAGETNTFWLRSLCAQPVTEILGKYRRKTDVQRTRYLWSRMFSTPGEKAILHAWTKNTLDPRKKPVPVTRASTDQGMTMSFRVDTLCKGSGTSAYSRLQEPPSSEVTRQMFSADEQRPKDVHYRNTQVRCMPSSYYRIPADVVDKLADPTLGVRTTETGDDTSELYVQHSRRKGELVLQQRKYFPRNRKNASTLPMQSLYRFNSGEMVPTMDRMCLQPKGRCKLNSQRDRNQSCDSRSAHDQLSHDWCGSDNSKSDIEQVQVRFPLVINTNVTNNNFDPRDEHSELE